MTDRLDNSPVEIRPAIPRNPYAEHPGHLPPIMPGYSTTPPNTTVTAGNTWKPYAIGAAIAGLLLFVGYQQYQIQQLSNELGIVSTTMKTSDVPVRLNAAEKRLDEVNSRLGYLDSKINAVDQKAQTSLNKWYTQETKGNIFTDVWKHVTGTLGL